MAGLQGIDPNQTYLRKPLTHFDRLQGAKSKIFKDSVMEPGFIESLTAPEGSPIDYQNISSTAGGRAREMFVDPMRRFGGSIQKGMEGKPLTIGDQLNLIEGMIDTTVGGLFQHGMMQGGLDLNDLYSFPAFQGRSKRGLKKFTNPDEVAWGTTDRGTAEQFADVKESYFPYRKPPETVREMRGEVYDLEFDIKKPMDVDISETLWSREKELAKIAEAKEKGFDGLRIKHPSGKRDYVAFSGDQIRKVDDVDQSLDYLGNHTSPDPEAGVPLSEMTGDIYPDDIYSSKATQYYGTGDRIMDADTVDIFQRFRGKPNEDVEIYRAVPEEAPNDINLGDWVTINPDYAIMHGEGPLYGDYKVISKTVKAKDIFTNGDSIHEWGYHPE